MHELTIDLGPRSYPVRIGAGLLRSVDAFDGALGARNLVVTSETVSALHLDALRAALGGRVHGVAIVPDGDAAKTLAHVGTIVESALAAGVARDGAFIALGGGALGDVAGLAAALYHRGIGWVNVPTTLLAQVDAAVGGKTAVNHRGVKNLVGAFHQPRRVVADVDILRTLPPRELRAGVGEVIKYALLEGVPACDALERALPALQAGDPAELEAAVLRCCRVKARFVADDETERGDRALLNLGHTFGHALESWYAGALLHGEAVALGCVIAARLSQSLGWLPARDAARVQSLVGAAGLPVMLPPPVPSPGELLALMSADKKVADGRQRLVLLRGLGAAVVTADYPRAALELTVRDFTSQPA